MKILAIAAHPDDETCASGTLLKYVSEGHEVYILMTTRGDGGSTGEPPVCERAELGRLCEQEGRNAGAVIRARAAATTIRRAITPRMSIGGMHCWPGWDAHPKRSPNFSMATPPGFWALTCK